jgi:hypothetical protein
VCILATGIAENSHLRKSNYFYYNCITGHFLRDNCPSYLREENFMRLQDGLIDNLTIASGFFLDELRARKYTKVRHPRGRTAGVAGHWPGWCIQYGLESGLRGLTAASWLLPRHPLLL